VSRQKSPASGRYFAPGPEAESEPGSRGRVLRNLLGIKSVREMERRESEALITATERLIDNTDLEQCFTADAIRDMHRLWLESIYAWAGDYRQVNVTKDEFMFAAANQVPRLMQAFEWEILRKFTPCRVVTTAAQAEALAVVHAELILIHPFRDGNGRCARLLAVLMGLQAGLPALDFGGVRGTEKRRYIAAIHAGLDRNYTPMAAVFNRIIARTMKSQARAWCG
jgi:cell filamentation protein